MSSEDISVTFKVSSDKKFDLTLQRTLTVLQTKELAQKECNIEPSRQRLIYRVRVFAIEKNAHLLGRILKDPETLASYSIGTGHTIHLVESGAPQQSKAAATTATVETNNAPTAPTVPPAAAAGAVPDLSSLMGAFGGMQGFGGADAFGGAQGAGFPGGMNPQLFQNVMSNPQVMAMMQEVMRNPELLRTMIESNPFLSSMAQTNPMFQNLLGNPEMMRAAMNPEVLQSVMGLQQSMHTQQQSAPASTSAPPATTTQATTPATGTFPAGAGTFPGAAGAFPGAAGVDFQSMMGRMMSDPAMMQQMQGLAESMRMSGSNPFGAGAGMNMFGGMPAATPVTITAESMTAQMQQLEDMGFIDKDANLLALQRTGGDVNAAIAWLLESGQGS